MADFIYAGEAGAFKDCPSCHQLKKSTDFHFATGRLFGINVYCKQCTKEKQAKRFAENREAVLAINKKWILANPDKVAERRKKHRRDNPGYDVEWRKKDLSRNRELARNRARIRRASNPTARINNAISCALRDQLSGKVKNGRKSFDLLDFTFDEFKKHIESLFKEGMTWDNYGAGGWEIDHIIPVSAHNFLSPDDIDFKRCWSLSNLQPLWASENRSKQASLQKSFQPSLAF